MAKPRDPNEHVPPGERQDHPAVQRMKRQKMMKTIKKWVFLLAVLGGLVTVYLWRHNWTFDPNQFKEEVSGGLTEAYKLVDEAYQRQTATPTDAELDQMVQKKPSKPPDAGTETPAPPQPDRGTPTPPTPAPTPQLSPEEQKAKEIIKEANKHYDESREHYEKFAASKDAAVRKREVNAAFDAVQKAKEGYQKAQNEYHVESDWLNQRLQECLQRYKVLKNAKGAN